MQGIPVFTPTQDNTFVISYPERLDEKYDFAGLFLKSRESERNGQVELACNIRYDAVKQFMNLIPDEDEIVLDWEEEDNQIVLELVQASAIDHFLVGDFEMAAGMMEMLLDMDPEDHLEATKPLAYCYVALGEYELFDEIIDDISDKYPEKCILKMWSEFRRRNEISHGEVVYFRKNFAPFFTEFIAAEHPVDQQYMTDIESAQPSKGAVAREMWLQTEHLWNQFPGFIQALQKS